MTAKDERLTALRDEIKDYQQTVNAIIAFAAFIVYDGKSRRPDSEFGLGRRMTTSPHNPVNPSTDITPDLVAQKSADYGIIAEAKKSLSLNESEWTVHVKRLRKYDDALEGWWTDDEKIKRSNAIMLIHHARSRRFSRFLEQRKSSDPGAVGSATCVVEFIQSDETVTYFSFRTEQGIVDDTELKVPLDDGIQVPLEKVLESFPSVQYYDAKPPLPLLLTHLWTGVFSSMIESGEYDERTGSTQIPVSVSDITGELQKAFGSGIFHQDSRSAEFPRQKWVREAFERLVKHKLAIVHPNGGDRYFVLYKPIRGDVCERFIRLEMKLERSAAKEQRKADANKAQIPLFPETNDG